MSYAYKCKVIVCEQQKYRNIANKLQKPKIRKVSFPPFPLFERCGLPPPPTSSLENKEEKKRICMHMTSCHIAKGSSVHHVQKKHLGV